jgi:WD40 repeat protein
VGFDAFISYSHAADGRLAPAVQLGLQRFAKPWYRVRALHVFRDETGLSTQPHLWTAIAAAMDEAEYFVLFASPEAAASPWVIREIEHWLETRPADHILPVLTDGELVWDSQTGDFDASRSSALPEIMRGRYAEEPRYLDLRWARSEEQLDLRHTQFRAAIADLAATIRGVPKDELEGEDVRQHRRLQLLTRGAIASLATLTIVAVVATIVALAQRRDALAQRGVARNEAHQATLHEVVAQSAALRPTQRDLAALLALAAYRDAPSTETYSALLSTVTSAGGIDRTVDVPTGSNGALLRDGHTYAAVDQNQDVHLIELATGHELARLRAAQTSIGAVSNLATSSDGRYLAQAIAHQGPRDVLTMWDVTARRRRYADIVLPFSPGSVAFNGDNSLVAVGGGPTGDVQVRRADDGALVATVRGLPRPDDAHLHTFTAALGFLADHTLAIASQNGPLRVVDPHTGRVLRTIDAPEEFASSLMVVAPDGRTVYGNGFNGMTRFDVDAGRLAWKQADGANCDAIAFDPAIDALLCSRNGTVLAFDALTGVLRGQGFQYQQGVAPTLIVADHDNELIEGGGNVLTMWRLDGGNALAHFLPGSANLVSGGFEADGSLVVMIGHPHGPPTNPRLVDPETGRVLDPLAGVVRASDYGQPAGRLRAGFADGTIGFYDTAHHRRVANVAIRLPFVPDGETMLGHELVIYTDSRMQGIDDTGRLVPPATARPPGSGDMLGSVDGSRLYSIEGNGALVTRRADGTRTNSPEIQNVAGMANTPYGLLLATGDGRLRLFEPHSMRVLAELPPPGDVARALDVASRGHRFVGALAAGTIRLGDLASRTYLGDAIGGTVDDTIDNGAFDPNSIPSFSDDGTKLAYTTAGGVVVWDLDPQHLIDAACRIAGRNLTASEWNQYLGGLTAQYALCPAAGR